MDKKRILIIDESRVCVDQLSLLLNEIASYEIDVIDTYDKATQFFDTYEYEFVIIDHNCKSANPFMEHVLTIKQNQKAILLSDSLNCPITCETCLQSFQFVRVLKPINFQEIAKFITGETSFECPNKYRFEGIDTLEKLYEFINLKDNVFYVRKELRDNKLFIMPKNSGMVKMDELSKVEDFINTQYFEFSVSVNYEIIITPVVN